MMLAMKPQQTLRQARLQTVIRLLQLNMSRLLRWCCYTEWSGRINTIMINLYLILRYFHSDNISDDEYFLIKVMVL